MLAQRKIAFTQRKSHVLAASYINQNTVDQCQGFAVYSNQSQGFAVLHVTGSLDAKFHFLLLLNIQRFHCFAS